MSYAKRNGVHPRGPGTWRLVASSKDEAGNPVQIRETFRGSLTDARRRQRELAVAVENGSLVGGRSESVRAFVERWIAHRQTINKIRPRTAQTYRMYAARWVPQRVGRMKLRDLRARDVQAVLDGALAAGLAPRSVLQLHRLLHAAFRQGVRWGVLKTNPSDGVTPPKAEAPKLITPTPAQIGELLRCAEEPFRAPLTLLAATGARRGEIAAARWDDVDLDGEHPFLRIVGTLQRVDGRLAVLAPKTERSRRVIPLPASVVPMLRRVRTEQAERRLLCGPAWINQGFVFDGGNGQPMDPDALTHAFERARSRAGIEGVRLHDLRHAFATVAMVSGTNPRTVSDLLGHATVSFTLQTYSHPSEEVARAAMAAVEVALGDALTEG